MSSKELTEGKKELADYQRTGMLEYIGGLLGKARWHEDQIEVIRKKLKEYSKMLGIKIDENKWEVIEDSGP